MSGDGAARAPALLWRPSPERNAASNFARYLDWLAAERGLCFSGYHDAWAWSTTEIESFWASLWDFFDVRASLPYETVLSTRRMPGARWFSGAELNYAEHALRERDVAQRESPALVFQSENRALGVIDHDELRAQVASVADGLRELGVRRGDRVAAFLPNIPEAVIAFLACASIGAIWSSCSPDFGTAGVIERFRQIEPSVLLAIDGYVYGGRAHDRRAAVTELRGGLGTLRHSVLVPHLDVAARVPGMLLWSELLERDVPLRFEQVPFEHPLWILYSSGTTGAPKAIVHGHGGILLEHLKALALQNDMQPGDRFFWHTTTGWMMWNLLVGGLLAGCSIVLYDGSATHPDPDVLWQLAQDARVTRFGAGAAYYTTCMKARLAPGHRFDLSALRAIGSTGSPLPPEAFRWIYHAVKRDVWLASSSGGTDVASAFLGACPTLPVHEGELQGAALGARVQAFDDRGHAVSDEVGELVITEPMPSMPVCFWNDPDGARYRESYFEPHPGIWRHGDWVRFTARGSAVICGRSDATLNRQGVRIGTSEIYRAVEAVPAVIDSLVIGIEEPGGGYWMPLFVVLEAGVQLAEPLREEIRARIRASLSARHVPDEIVQVPAVPRTLNGKKLEVPVKKILLGARAEEVVNAASLSNPEALDFFIRYAAGRRRIT
jgi:acetoacetyl-CoA synthetase